MATALLLGSYLALFEFARRSQAVIRGTGPGPWLTWAVAAMPVSAALILGAGGLDPASRVLVAVPATVWTAFILATAFRRAAPGQEGGGALAWAAFCLATYGVVAGVVLPAGTAVPHGWPTMEAFVAATGVPIQLVRGSTIGGAALGIWAYAISLDTQGRVVRKRWRFFWVAAATLGLVLAGGWVVTEQLGLRHDEDLAAQVQADAAQVQDHLVMEMEATSDAARTAAGIISRFDLAPAVARRRIGPPRRRRGRGRGTVNRITSPTCSTRRARPWPRPIAGAPRASPGRATRHRPYFRDAMAGAPGRFIGLGLTSGKPGFYASEPIRDGRAGSRRRRGREARPLRGLLRAARNRDLLPGGPGRARSSSPGAEAWKDRPMWSTRPGRRNPAARRARARSSPAPFTGPAGSTSTARATSAVRIPLPALDWSIVAR